MHVAQCIINCLALERIRHCKTSDIHDNAKHMLSKSGILPGQQNDILAALNNIPEEIKFDWLEFLFHLVLSKFAKRESETDFTPHFQLAFEKRISKVDLYNVQIALMLLEGKNNLSTEEIDALTPLMYAPISRQIIPLKTIKKLANVINNCTFILFGIDKAMSSNSYFSMNHCLNYSRLILCGVDLNYFGNYLEHAYSMIVFHSKRTFNDTPEHRILNDAIIIIHKAFTNTTNDIAVTETSIEATEENTTEKPRMRRNSN